jgi:hypothetical protein
MSAVTWFRSADGEGRRLHRRHSDQQCGGTQQGCQGEATTKGQPTGAHLTSDDEPANLCDCLDSARLDSVCLDSVCLDSVCLDCVRLEGPASRKAISRARPCGDRRSR